MKVQRIYETSLEINFNSPSQEFSIYWDSFLKSDIGKIYVSIPWKELIGHFKIVSQIPTYFSGRLDIGKAQKILARHWKPFIEHPNIMLTDATCYETSMRYPTNVKLLWESVDWCYGQLKTTCKYLKIRTPRTKYLKQKERFSNYSRKRRKSKRERKVLTRSLLHLLDKLLFLLKVTEKNYPNRFTMPAIYYRQIKIINKVLVQRQEIFETG